MQHKTIVKDEANPPWNSDDDDDGYDDGTVELCL